MKLTLVLTSKQNFVWTSMQEIIPSIIQSWSATQNTQHKVHVVDVDEQSLKDFLPELIQADQIVATCFTPKIFKILRFLRNEMSSPARLFIHLHNQATIACWPLRHWGGADLFREKDIFISSCERDANCLKVTFPKAQCVVIPFSYVNYHDDEIKSPPPNRTEVPFIYIGRLSSQKNLHTLILSFSLFKKKNPGLQTSLTFVGKEDCLGSPNMGISESGYGDYLRRLCQNLSIENHVIFEGFKDRAWIQDLLNKQKYIFAAPSLHSDENFGMAAFQCLSQKHLAVLSDWGGHSDFKKHFPDQTYLTPVYKTPIGPTINPLELAQNLELSARDYRKEPQVFENRHYFFESLIKKNFDLLFQPIGTDVLLSCSEESNRILAKAENSSLATSPKIFDSYSDTLCTPFFSAYGMNVDLKRNSSNSKFYFVPWLAETNNTLVATDPHKGRFECPFPPSSSDALDWAFSRGWIYQIESH